MHHGVADKLAVPVRIGGVVGRILGRLRIGEVVKLNVLRRVRHFHDVGRHLQAGIALIGHAHPAGFALAGGDYDYAVRSTYAVDGRCGCVLKDCQGLYIVGRQEVDIVHEYTVNHVERIGIVTYGTHAAHLHGRARSGSAALGDLDAADHALQCRHGVGRRLTGELVSLNIYYRGGEVSGFLGAVTDYHHLLQEGLILFESHQCGDLGGFELQAGIAHAADFHHSVGAGDRKHIVSVHACGRTVKGAGLDYRGSDYGAQFVLHDTLHLVRLTIGKRGGKQRSYQYQ